MAQSSYFWDDTTVGDATLAPYDEADFYAAVNDIYGGQDGFVIPEYLNDLECVPETSDVTKHGYLYVYSGAAICQGVFYDNDLAVSFQLDSAANNRLDRIVLRRDTAANTVRLAVIKGVEAANPAMPALTAEDLALWYVWVPAGFNNALHFLSAVNFHDEREFGNVGPLSQKYDIRNLMHNSEFMAYSQGHVGTAPPDMWYQTGAPPVIQKTAAIGSQVRGWSVDVQLVADTLGTYITIPTKELVARSGISGVSARGGGSLLTLKGTLKLKTGSVDLYIRDDTPATIVQKTYNRITTHDFILRFEVDLTSTTYIQLYFSGTCTLEIGQLMLVPGYIPGPFREKREVIFFDALLTDAAWTGATKSSGTYNIDLNATFQTNVPRGTRCILVRHAGQDTGSAAGAPYSRLHNRDVPLAVGDGRALASYVNVQGVTNSIRREDQGFVALDDTANQRFEAYIVATGALAYTIAINIIGVVT